MSRPESHRAWHAAASLLGIIKLIARAQPPAFAGMLVLDLALGASPLASAWLTKVLFDTLAQGFQSQLSGDLIRQLLILLALQTALNLTSQLLGGIKTYLNAELSRSLTLTVQGMIYRKLNRFAGLAYFEDARFYDSIQLAGQGAQQGPMQILNMLTTLLGNTVTLLSFLGILLAFNPLLVAIVALAALPQLYAQLAMGRRRFALALDNSPRARLAHYYSQVLSNILFAKELRLFGLGEYFLNLFFGQTRAIQQQQRSQQLHELRWQTGLALCVNLVSSGAFLAIVFQAASGHLSIGDVLLYLSAVASIQGALSGLVFACSNMHESILFYTRFTDLLALPQPIALADPPHPVPPLRSGIEFRRVSFRYSADHPWILRDLDLCIPAGCCVALVGANGAGKTSLVKLLTRLYDPTEGAILWDGVDIRMFDPCELRRRIGAIFQDFVHYDLTAYENIGLGDVETLADQARVQQAARQAGIHTVIERLPQGYDTLLSRWLAGEGVGAELSGGEWQKVALARMFMRTSDLLVLDEPTAALDAEAEYEVYHQFSQLVRGRTSLLITHRFSTVRLADAIAVLEDGRITEYGSHDELSARANTYSRLYQMQAECYR